MSSRFPVQFVSDLSDIPENYLSSLGISLPNKRHNELSHQSEGSVIVFVYKTKVGEKVSLFDRVKDVESYLRATEDNYDYDPREILQVYVVNN